MSVQCLGVTNRAGLYDGTPRRDKGYRAFFRKGNLFWKSPDLPTEREARQWIPSWVRHKAHTRSMQKLREKAARRKEIESWEATQ